MTDKKQKTIREQLRLMRQYNRAKLKELGNCLDLLIKFARDDLERIDKIEKRLEKSSKEQQK
jgi:hypothetical protein